MGLGNSIGRFVRAMIRVFSFGFIKMAEPIENNPQMMGLQYDEIIRDKAIAAQQIKNAIGGIIAQEEIAKQKLWQLTKEIEQLEQEKEGAQALAQERVKKLRAQKKPDSEIATDSEVQQMQAAYADAASTIQEKHARAKDLEEQINTLKSSSDNYIVQAQNLAREVEKLRGERHEAVADMIAQKQFDSINEALAGISTSGADNELADLRQRRTQAKGRAIASSKIAGVDVSAQRATLRAAAKKHITNADFMKGLGLSLEEETPSETAAPSTEVPSSASASKEQKLPE